MASTNQPKPRHICETMKKSTSDIMPPAATLAPGDTDESTQTTTATKPLPATPVGIPGVFGTPVSSFFGYRRGPPLPLPRQSHQVPRCNHILMTRLYGENLLCDECKSPSPLRWLYRCIQDHDILILERRDHGLFMPKDDLTAAFVEHMSLGKYGPDKRSAKNSFLYEISPEQMASYTPAQLAEILSQRDHVHEAIARDRNSPCPPGNKAWLPEPGADCRFKVCQRCYRHGKDKTWVSLDGVLNGDISPDLATATSFQHLGGRPVYHADALKSLGYRAVPMPYGDSGDDDGVDLTLSSCTSLEASSADIINEYIGQSESDNFDASMLSYSHDIPPRRLPYPPGFAPQPLRTLRRTDARIDDVEETSHVQFGDTATVLSEPSGTADDKVIKQASKIPLPWASMDEELFFADGRTVVQELEDDGFLADKRLTEDIDAVALSEEGTELEIAGPVSRNAASTSLAPSAVFEVRPPEDLSG